MPLDALLAEAGPSEATHLLAHSTGSYTTNLPLRGLELLRHDQPGYWEVNGYHLRGDPWREQRHDDD